MRIGLGPPAPRNRLDIRWPIQPGTVDPNQRWVWHTPPRFILPSWEHASAGAAQRYVRLAQTRRTARTWQLNTGAAAMRTPHGPGVSISTTDGAEIEALAGSNPSFAAWEQNEPYRIALRIKGRSGASTKHLYRSGTSSIADHILWLSSGTTPNLRHQASGGGTVTITSSVAIVNDTTWSTIVGTWRSGRLERYVDGFSRASSTSGGDQQQRLVRHLSLGLGLLDVAGLQRRHRADRVLRLILDPRHGAALARRSVRLPAPIERGACAYWQCATHTPPFDRHRRGHLPHG